MEDEDELDKSTKPLDLCEFDDGKLNLSSSLSPREGEQDKEARDSAEENPIIGEKGRRTDLKIVTLNNDLAEDLLT